MRTQLPTVPRSICLCLFLALLLLAGPVAWSAKQSKIPEDFPAKYRAWLEEVDLIISKEEREAFLKLEKDYQRDAFIERFWRVRDPYPNTARNEYRERWNARVEQARSEFGGMNEDRSRILLLNGPPAARIKSDCTTLLWPLEVWFYDGSEQVGFKFFVIFVQRGGIGPYRIWHPAEGLSSLLQFAFGTQDPLSILQEIRDGCRDGDLLAGAIARVLQEGTMGYSTVLLRIESRPEPAQGEWVASFAAYSTDLPEGAERFQASLDLHYPGRRQSRTVVQATLAVPVEEAGLAELAGHRSYNFLLTGEVLHEGELFDTFRYKFDFPATQVTGETLPLVFERHLRPGTYALILKLEDLNSGKFHREEREVDVPSVEAVASQPLPPADPETARLLAEANAAIARGETTLKIVPPQGDLHTGLVRFDTLATGEEIDRVVFSLDGRQVLIKRKPPYSVELDLGPLPRARTLEVAALDADGKILAKDELTLNAGGHRFAVRLMEPQPGQRYVQSLRARAEVETPEDKAVERVEFYLNETLVATLYQPPFVQPIVLPEEEAVAYIRAVAYLPDDNSTEDVVFVNAPDYFEEINVQFVELYTTVVDRSGRPVTGLTKDDFTVFEDGVRQEIARFDYVRNLPFHVGILLDVSASMEESLEAARQAALAFFQQAITPRDRATMITFNDRPNLAVKFTNDVSALAGGLAGLKAERGTALYDSVIFGLYYFNGIKGQRALLVLTDGKDENSRFGFEDTLEYARRAGVTVYTIGLNLGRLDIETRRKLSKLAEETGGRSFFIDSATDLEPIYQAIQQELRSQYFLAYQSSNTGGETEFRTVEVKVSRSDLEAKTLRGYYP